VTPVSSLPWAAWRRGALVVGLATVLLAAAPAPASVPPDFPIKTAESSPGQVTFSHARHLPAVQKCSLCHMRDFKMKRGASGPVTLAAKQEGRFCGACHDGKTVLGGTTAFSIDQCDGCHKP
jgi:c(7)-type cytochrome triheme protein